MKRFSNITAVETKATLQERLVEKFVQQNLPPTNLKHDRLYGMGNFSALHNEIEVCAAELPVNGAVEIFFIVKNAEVVKGINHPVMARFIVFCTREENYDYKCAWSCSLS